MKFRKMNAKQFAERLMNLKENETLEFGCSCTDYDIAADDLNEYDVEDWYFARIIHVDEYESRFILIDYCGGEEAYAIPLNSYSEDVDEDDEGIIRYMVNEYFKHHNRFISSVDDFVYVEGRDEENS